MIYARIHCVIKYLCAITIFIICPHISAAQQRASDFVYGIHLHQAKNFEQLNHKGFSAIRLWDSYTSWRDVQPYSAQYKLDNITAVLQASQSLGMKATLVLGSTPQWASSRPTERCSYGYGCAAEPANLADWRRYVKVISNTYRGQIECYEPWNEVSFPNEPVFKRDDGGEAGQFYSGSINGLVEIAKVTFEEVKKADPSACVLSPSFHSSGDWIKKLDQYLIAGGGKYMDAVSFHFYFGDEPEESVRNIRAVKAVLKKHGMDDIQIWNSEIGIPFFEKKSIFNGVVYEDMVYALVLRTYIVNMAEDIPRLYWYSWDNNNLGLNAGSLNGQVAGEAIVSALRLIGTRRKVSCITSQGVWQCDLTGSDGKLRVLWATRDAKPAAPIKLQKGGWYWGARREYIDAGALVTPSFRPIIINW